MLRRRRLWKKCDTAAGVAHAAARTSLPTSFDPSRVEHHAHLDAWRGRGRSRHRPAAARARRPSTGTSRSGPSAAPRGCARSARRRRRRSRAPRRSCRRLPCRASARRGCASPRPSARRIRVAARDRGGGGSTRSPGSGRPRPGTAGQPRTMRSRGPPRPVCMEAFAQISCPGTAMGAGHAPGWFAGAGAVQPAPGGASGWRSRHAPSACR